MKYHDEALRFDCEGDELIGVLSRPETPREVGVIILVGGPQYRVGGHRQYVLLARALAAAGYPVLRFDYRGNGDSSGARRNYECVSADIGAAVDTLQQNVPAVGRVALWGLCGGASAALIYCHDRHNPRIAGLCLMNPWVRTETSLARTHVRHYYRDRIKQREFWIKLASGQVAWNALRGFVGNVRLAATGDRGASASSAPTFQQRMAAAWHACESSMLLMISGQDYTAREFLDHVRTDPAWAGALEHRRLQRCDLPDADHTCSEPTERARMQAIILEWLSTLAQDALSGERAAPSVKTASRRPPTVHRTSA